MEDNETPETPAGSDATAAPPADTPNETPAAAPEAGADAGPKSMLDAINAGIDAVTNGAPPPADEDAEPVKPQDTPEEPAKPAAAKGAPKEPAKDAGKEPPPKDDKAAAAKEPKPKPKPKEPEPAGPIDAVNDPIPAEVKGRTRERMTQLITNVKEVSAERDQVRGQFNEILGMIEETGATPEQYGQALDYLRAVNSRDPAQIKAAIQTAQRELAALAAMIGEPVAGVDMLAQHPDLGQEVEDGKISRARAEEIAAARARRASDEQQGVVLRQQREQQQRVNHAKQRLNVVETELRGTDPLYEQKRAMLVPMLQPIFETLPPAQWERAFRAAYAKLTLPAGMPAAGRAPRAGAPAPSEPLRAGQQPLRATQHAGSAQRQVGSMLDAINEGIEVGTRRR